LTFSASGNFLAAACEDGSVTVFDVLRTQPVVALPAPAQNQKDVGICFLRRDDRLLIMRPKQTVFWTPAGGVENAPFVRPAYPAERIVAVDHSHIARPGPGATNAIEVIDCRTGAIEQAAKDTVFHSLAVSADANQLAASRPGGKVVVWDLSARKELYELQADTQAVHGLSFTSDGTRLATVGYDRVLRVWDTARRIELVSMRPFISPNRFASGDYLVTPDGVLDAVPRSERASSHPEAARLRGVVAEIVFAARDVDDCFSRLAGDARVAAQGARAAAERAMRVALVEQAGIGKAAVCGRLAETGSAESAAAAVRGDGKLSAHARAVAIAEIGAMPADELRREAWTLVAPPGRAPEAYRNALATLTSGEPAAARGSGGAKVSVAFALLRLNDLHAARAALEELHRSVGTTRGGSVIFRTRIQVALAIIDWKQGDLAAARARLDDAIRTLTDGREWVPDDLDDLVDEAQELMLPRRAGAATKAAPTTGTPTGTP
jgi:hypothetical protein